MLVLFRQIKSIGGILAKIITIIFQIIQFNSTVSIYSFRLITAWVNNNGQDAYKINIFLSVSITDVSEAV